MKTTWKIWLLLYGVLAQLVLLRVMIHLLFSARAGTYLTNGLPTNLCAAALGGATLTWLMGSSFNSLSHGQGIPIRIGVAWSGICGIAATTVTYEVLLFAASVGITLNSVQGEGAAFSVGRFLLTLLSAHVYTFFDYLPVAALGFVSGVAAGWFVLKAWRTNSTTGGTPLIPTRP